MLHLLMAWNCQQNNKFTTDNYCLSLTCHYFVIFAVTYYTTMKQQCYICKKWYTGIIQHLQRSMCIENARKKNVPAVPFHVVQLPETETFEINKNDSLASNLDMLGMDPGITSNQHSPQTKVEMMLVKIFQMIPVVLF